MDINMTGFLININLLGIHISEFITVKAILDFFWRDIFLLLIVGGFVKYELGKNLYPEIDKRITKTKTRNLVEHARASYHHHRQKHHANNIYQCSQEPCDLVDYQSK